MRCNQFKYFLVICFGVLCLTACQSNNSAKKTPIPTTERDYINIYTVSPENFQVEPLKLMIDKMQKITPEFVVNKVRENLEEDIGIKEVTMVKDKVTVTFKANKAPLKNVSPRMESGILDAISNSLLDNISTCNEVYFNSTKGAYKGVEITLDQKEAYASR